MSKSGLCNMRICGFPSCYRMARNDCTIFVQTGDKKAASTDANVFIILHDEHGIASPQYKLDKFLRDDFKCGAIDEFKVKLPQDFGTVSMIEFWRDNAGISANWYVDIIKVEQIQLKTTSIFPIFRWIEAQNVQNRYRIYELDTFLPQFDPNLEQREKEIKHKREHYVINYMEEMPDMPVLVKDLPIDEQFSAEYVKNLILTKIEHFYLNLKAKVLIHEWDSFDDIDKIYDNERNKPLAADHWNEDVWFGNQRLVGCNPALIKLCTEIPEKFGVNEEMMKPVLNGETLDSLMEKKRLFLTDLVVIENLRHNENFKTCAPIALFMLSDEDQLMPIAIQLNQQKGPENPVFLPTDDYYVWLMAKLWYNNADAAYHQSVLHIGWTHFLMEGVILAIHRNISVSHPIFKLMAPHTLFLMAINSRGLKKLVSEGGWVDTTMAIGVKGMYDLVGRCQKKWRFDLQGTPPAEFKSRNVEDPKVLPNYHFRDDSLLIYDIIRTYVTNYVDLYYENDKMLLDDWEIQNWAEDMARKKSEGGIGLACVPERDGKAGFYNIDDLVMVLSSILYTCSAGHAAANFLQYSEYAYPPNYPSQIRGEVIKDKKPRTEKDIIQSLPDRNVTLNVMTITHLLSEKATNSLGDFETQYIYDPKALKVLAKFRDDLNAASIKITKRNNNLRFPFEVLLPENIPNAISI